MKLLRIAAVAALTAYGGIFAGAGNAAPAAGLFTGAPTVRTLATPAPEASVEKAYYWHHAIIGTIVIIGIATIIGTAAIITGITIGGRITIATIITIGIRIIGNSARAKK